VLIDGAHGFPYPILDWWYVAPHVKVGGHVLLDDAYLPAVPAIVAGASLVFLTVVKELPLALLLAPIGFETLPTEIWKLTQIGAYSRASVPALMLILVSAPVLYLVSADRRPRSGSVN